MWAHLKGQGGLASPWAAHTQCGDAGSAIGPQHTSSPIIATRKGQPPYRAQSKSTCWMKEEGNTQIRVVLVQSLHTIQPGYLLLLPNQITKSATISAWP